MNYLLNSHNISTSASSRPLVRHSAKRKKSNDTSDNESDDDISVQLIEPPPSVRETIKSVSRAKLAAKKRSPSKSSVAKAKIATEDKLQEENAYIYKPNS